MQCIQSYGSGSDSSSNSTSSSSSSDSESDNGESTAHLRPIIDTTNSVAKTLSVVAAPNVIPMVSNPF